MEGILNFPFAVRKITGSNPEACLIPLTGSDPSYATVFNTNYFVFFCGKSTFH